MVTITGTGFGSTQGAGTVTFSGVIGTPTSWNATTIRVPVPPGAATGSVVVRASGVNSNGKTFTVPPAPHITGLSPTAGVAGSAVTIAGSGFGSTKGSSTVQFNGTPAATTSWSPTTLVATVPDAATTGAVIVTVAGAASNGVAFTVPTLVSMMVTPDQPSVPRGATRAFTATGRYSDASIRTLTSSAAWRSSDLAVAAIEATGIATGATVGETTIEAAVGPIVGSTVLTVTPSRFVFTGSLRTPRAYESATRLADGTVLMIGGSGSTNEVLTSAEVYDPVKGVFTTTGRMATVREAATATLLTNGKVLVVGGWNRVSQIYVDSAELYDPLTGTFAPTGSLTIGRGYHAATRLDNGMVLIAGGNDNSFGFQATCEVYDPATETFVPTGALQTVRYSTATRLIDGTVLFAGGQGVPGPAELYDPVLGTFSATGRLHTESSGHTATLLPNGLVLIAGGYDAQTGLPMSRAELYDPVARTFSTTGSLITPRQGADSVLLTDGQVLIVAGEGLGRAELYDPLTGTFASAGALNVARSGHASTGLADGTVLVAAGGYAGGATPVASAEIYLPGAVPPAPSALQISPGAATLLIGEARAFTAVDTLGHPRADATWMVSDPGLATIDTDGSLTLTAVAAGSVTLTASIGGVSAQAQVTLLAGTSLPAGTVQWSSPAPIGLSSKQVVHAMPSGDGPALYAVSGPGEDQTVALAGRRAERLVQAAPADGESADTLVEALTADGQQLLHTWLPALNGRSVPDGFGGLIVTEFNRCDHTHPMKIVDVDGATGQWRWEAVGTSACTVDAPHIAVRQDGAVVVTTPGNTSGFPELMMIQGRTGQLLPAPEIPRSIFEDITGQMLQGYSRIGPPMIDGNGVTYVEYEVRQVAYPPRVVSTTLWLMAIDAGYNPTTTKLTTTDTDTNLFPGRIIPDGRGGVIATWVVSPSQPPALEFPFRAAHVSADSMVSYTLPIATTQLRREPSGVPVNPTLVLGQGRRAFVTNSTNTDAGPELGSFDVDSGDVYWSYRASPQSTITLLAATAEGGIAIDDSEIGIVQFDVAGSASAVTGILGGVPTYSWTGEWTLHGPQGPSGLTLPVEVDHGGLWASPQGNASHNGVGIALCPCLTQSTPDEPPAFAARSHFASSGALSATTAGTFVDLVGDPGLGEHNVGRLFDLAQSTHTSALPADGSTVFLHHVSSVQDFNAGLTGHGSITGGVNYFGHAGQGTQAAPYTVSMLFAGQTRGADTNVSELNANQLSNSQMAPTATVTIYACHAGLRPFYRPTAKSVAQVLADRLGRTVYAWRVAMFFAENQNERLPSSTKPRGPSIFMIPTGGLGVRACEFKPGQPEPAHCGGGE